MVSMDKLVQFSKKTEDEVKKDIKASLEKLVPITGMTDSDKLSFVMNELFAKYSKEQFSFGGSSTTVEGVFIGAYDKTDNVSYVRKEIDDFFKKQPNEAKKLCMVDNDGNYLYYETQDKFEAMEDWQRNKKFVPMDDKYVENNPSVKGMTPFLKFGGTPYIGLPIPAYDGVRFAHGYEIVDGKKIDMVVKFGVVKNRDGTIIDNASKDVPLLQQGKFKGFRVENMSTDTLSYYTASGEFKFDFVKAAPDKEVEEFIKTQTSKFYTLSDFNKVDGTVKRNSYAIFKVRIQDIGILENEGQIYKVYDDTIELGEDDAEGKKIVPFTVYPPKGYKATFGDGAEIYVMGNPYTSSKGTKTISACGIFVPSIYKNLMKHNIQNIEL